MAIAAAHRSSTVRDIGLLIARVVLGVVFVAHGWQKIDQFGIAGVTENFRGLGVPLPELAAPFIAYLELIGGILLIVGLLTPIVGVLLTLDMVVAAILVHVSNGLFIDQGGWELVGVLGAGALALAAAGPGRLSVDHAYSGRRGARRRSASAATGETA
ncbi:DoxX family protein [Brachybacterium sp. AOP25-B2-12]|uniref:DoxX family protein n=1 Tax=Brachybacterium sp. AOP25-B2-12 TaxID=3457710 RepID=UPI004034AF3E